MENLIPIGRFSKICRLSIPALRYYDEVGLLRPALVDPASSYRYYRLSQVRDAETIRLLRALDVPLDEIRQILCEPDRRVVDRLLDQHQARMEARVAESLRILSYLRRLKGDQANLPPAEVRVRVLDPADALGISARVPEQDVSGAIRASAQTILDHLRRLGRRPIGPAGALFPDPEHDELAVRMTVFVPSDRPCEAHQGAVPQVLPGGPAVSVTHHGPYALLDRSYQALVAWAQRHGHELVGPPRELYRAGPLDGGDPNDYRTEIQWPIR